VNTEGREGTNAKKWNMRKLQGNKETRRRCRRRIEETIGENRWRQEGNVEEN
jgi:hypothetical protein